MRITLRQHAGFSLIELIMVIVLLGAVVALSSVFIVGPFQAYDDVRNRADLVNRANQALELMHRELRNALPNSVRVTDSGNRHGVEFLRTTHGGRYREAYDGSGGGDILDFDAPDDSFDIMGTLPDDPDAPGTSWVVIYNLSAGGCTAGSDPNAYCGGPEDNRAAMAADNSSSASSIQLDAPFRFPYRSPQQRFYVVDTPVSFVCDEDTGEIRRFQGYSIQAGQPINTGDFGGVSGALVVDGISSCSFAYDDGAGTRNGLVTAKLALTGQGETISLLDQTHVLNAP